jgi:hypothetical protein
LRGVKLSYWLMPMVIAQFFPIAIHWPENLPAPN